MSSKFSMEKLPNWVIIVLSVFLFAVYLLFFDKDRGYYAVRDQQVKNDTLLLQCNDLRKQITADSTALESVYDSTKFEHYLREQRLFIGEGETMYKIDE